VSYLLFARFIVNSETNSEREQARCPNKYWEEEEEEEEDEEESLRPSLFIS
jgi:hypothetical protein